MAEPVEPTIAQRAAVLRALREEGHTILTTKAYLAAQERLRCAKALLACEREHLEATRQWAMKAFDAQREAWDRTTYLYGLAASLGATAEQLAGPSASGRPS